MATPARRAATFSIAALLLTSIPVEAQETPYDTLVGHRIRLTIADELGSRFDGTLVRVEEGHLLIHRSDTSPGLHESVALSAVRSLDVQNGRARRTKKGLITGAIALSLAGCALGFVDGVMACDGVPDCSITMHTVAGTSLGAGVGAGVGAAIGSLLERDQWKPVPVSVPSTSGLSIQPTRGGMRASFSVRF